MNRAYIVSIHQQDWKDYTSYYIMEHSGHGMVRVTQNDDARDEFIISDLYVEEKWRGQGLGEYLLDYAIGLCKRVSHGGSIAIETSDYSATFCDEWYQKLGFVFDHLESGISLEDESSDDELEWRKVYIMKF